MFNFLPWERDDWLSTDGNILLYDKLEHFILGVTWMMFVWVWCIITNGHSHEINDAIVGVSFYAGLFIATLWEIKDGVISNGFSWKDLLAGIIGLSIGLIITINL